MRVFYHNPAKNKSRIKKNLRRNRRNFSDNGDFLTIPFRLCPPVGNGTAIGKAADIGKGVVINMKLRRMLFVLLMVLLAGTLTGCVRVEAGERRRFQTVFVGSMDTVVRFTAYCVDDAEFDRACERVRSGLEKADALFNAYREDSSLSRVNAGAGTGPVAAPSALAAALEECRAWQAAVPAANVAMGSVLSLWHTARETGEPPEREAVAAALSHTSMDAVRVTGLEIDGEDAAVAIDDPALSLNLGGVAKGLAARSITDGLRESGLDCFLLDCGTSTLVCAGAPPGKAGWTIALRNPDASLNRSGTETPPATLGQIALKDCCVGTSGDYQKYFEKNGTFYSHIIDTTTGYPADYVRAVTVLTEDAGAADFYSTALFAQPYEQARALAERTPGLEALWVFQDGSRAATSGFPPLEPPA